MKHYRLQVKPLANLSEVEHQERSNLREVSLTCLPSPTWTTRPLTCLTLRSSRSYQTRRRQIRSPVIEVCHYVGILDRLLRPFG